LKGVEVIAFDPDDIPVGLPLVMSFQPPSLSLKDEGVCGLDGIPAGVEE
jgi:hypothetical protein